MSPPTDRESLTAKLVRLYNEIEFTDAEDADYSQLRRTDQAKLDEAVERLEAALSAEAPADASGGASLLAHLREVVAKWRNSSRTGSVDPCARDAYHLCADELDALLSAGAAEITQEK